MDETLTRISFDEIYMQLAELVAKRSTCKRLSVGCVIVTPDYKKVISLGYNGNASGLQNTCDADTPGACGDLHAEENAIINCDSPRSLEKIVYVTHSPCLMCAKRFINLGNVKAIYFKNEYRDTSHLKMLKDVGINCESIYSKWMNDWVDYWHDESNTKNMYEFFYQKFRIDEKTFNIWRETGEINIAIPPAPNKNKTYV